VFGESIIAGVKRLQAFKFELMPNGEQRRQMRRYAGCCRFVYNQALALQRAHYEAGGPFIGYVAMAKRLTAWRHSTESAWLKEAPVHPLQQKLKDLERAYQNFFSRRARFPRFKKKGVWESFRYPDAKQIKLEEGNSRLFLPKLGWLRYRNSREVLGAVRNVTVSQSCGKWFVSIQTQREVEPGIAQGAPVGIDVGIARFATLSDGSGFAALNAFKAQAQRLARAQRALSRKVKFSSNWRKQQSRVQRIHARIGHARRDYLHKTSTTISKNHAMVCMEDLQVKNMSKSAKGTVDQPGRHVRAKSGLNRAILDQGWSEFRRQLAYKLSWRGGILIGVPAHNTSKLCPLCDHVAAENRRTQATFKCVACGYENHADVVGAMNILARGHRVLACREASSGRGPEAKTKPASMKQEPAEETVRSAA
jgi:putative transposase